MVGTTVAPSEAMLEELTSWYRGTIDRRASALAAAVQGLESDDEAAEATVRRMAHQLRGSAASYGFPRISEVAAEVELAPAGRLAVLARRLLDTLVLAEADGPLQPACVLVVDDDPAVLHFARAHLGSRDRQILVAADAATAHRLLRVHEVAIVLLDLNLGSSDGRDLLVEIRSSPATEDVPIAILSATGGQALQAECFDLGADAFFTKPTPPEVLTAALGTLIRRHLRARRSARVDPLTGLLNRRGLEAEYRLLAAHSARHCTPLSLALLDLDRFKLLNDTHGHAVGDEVLRGCAKVLQGRLRGSDVIGRWGGEEFVVLFPETEPAGAIKALEGALEDVRDMEVSAANKKIDGVSFSAGVTDAGQATGLAEAVADADRPLYIAKASGRARVLGPEAELVEPSARVLLLEDGAAAARLTSATLGHAGFEVVLVTDLAAAREALSEGPLDLAVFDRNLPDGDSIDLLAELRADEAFAAIPVLVLTTLDHDSELARTFDAGADDYLVKPCSQVELVSRLRRLLVRSRPTPVSPPLLEKPR